jgi:hypothetical protein
MSATQNHLTDVQRWHLFVFHAKQIGQAYLGRSTTVYWPVTNRSGLFCIFSEHFRGDGIRFPN